MAKEHRRGEEIYKLTGEFRSAEKIGLVSQSTTARSFRYRQQLLKDRRVVRRKIIFVLLQTPKALWRNWKPNL